MDGFYDALQRLKPDCRNMAMTVLDGAFLGEKALLADGQIVWKSQEDGILARQEGELGEIREGGIYRIGKSRIFCEVLGGEKKLVICGGGHVSIPLIRMGKMIGCRVSVLEERPQFAQRAKDAGADTVFDGGFEEGLAGILGDKDTFFVIVTRGHEYDQVCLECILKKERAYVGMIGSRKKVAEVRGAMLKKGFLPEILDSVYTPIGLDIGAETPEEIAVAIMAEVIQVKNKRRSSGYPQKIIDAIVDKKKAKVPAALVTIVARKGSAPRKAGAKMLIMPDGSQVGTVGGGLAEARFSKEAVKMLAEGKEKAKLCHMDLTMKEAGEEGMVCGGEVDVLLEVV